MIIDDKQMTIRDDQGNEHLVEILFTYEHDERKKKYVFFYEKITQKRLSPWNTPMKVNY